MTELDRLARDVRLARSWAPWVRWPAIRRLKNMDWEKIHYVEALGPLCIALQVRMLRTQTREALMRLLAVANADALASLDDSERASLRNALASRHPIRESDFLVALLRAIERSGDVEYLPVVRALADLVEHSPTYHLPSYKTKYRPSAHYAGDGEQRERRVWMAARSCLRHLERRIEKLNQEGPLLKPASAADEETLVRPAGTVHADTEELLRSVEPP